METLDLNLLVALDALLEEGSVTGAATRLHTSAPAMSRTLGRLRRVLGDPVMVRAGRHLVLTPRAVELRPAVAELVQRARGLLVAGAGPDLATLERIFTLQVGDAAISGLAATLLAAVRRQAPGVTVRFLPDTVEGSSALRDGRVDLEVGVVDHLDPETRVEPVATGRFVGVVRERHPLATGRLTARRFAAADHVGVSRQGRLAGPIDDALRQRGLRRRVVAVVPTFADSVLLARDADLVCLAPAVDGRPPLNLPGLRVFEIPVELPPVTVAIAWHPRNDSDGAHRWLRDTIRAALAPTAA